MKKLFTLIVVFIIGFANASNGQSVKELEIIQKIQNIDNFIIIKGNDSPSIKSNLRKFNKIARKNKKDPQLSAVTNALIGKALSDKKYFKEATKFLKKAYKSRKKQGDFYPQRWALKALMENGKTLGDYDLVKKYAKVWVDLANQFPDKIKKIHDYQTEAKEYFEDELELLILNLHPEVWRESSRKRYGSWDKRRETCHEIVKYYFQKFPNNRARILSISKNLYHDILEHFLNKNDLEKALYWKNKSTKMFEENASGLEYSDFLRFIAAHFKQKDGWFGLGLKTTKYEYVGIELIKKYIETCKKIKRFDQVLFGYRYIATRYVVLNDYKNAVQYLATAMKYCHTYKMENETVKSRGGLHLIIQSIGGNKNKSALFAAKDWKNGFDLSGLTKEEIEDFDSILKGVSW
ncbi:MAG: hypothetical protein AB8F94_06070 [Saprospiraceae bacterium]